MSLDRDRTALEIFRDVAAGICFLTLSFTAVMMGMFFLASRKDIHATAQQTTLTLASISMSMSQTSSSIGRVADSVDKMRTQVDRMVIIVSGTATNVEKATRSLKVQEDAQALYWGQTATNVSRLTEDADSTILAVKPVLASLNGDLTELKPVLINASKVFGDPNIPLTIASMARTSGNVELISGDMRKITLSGVDTADQLDQSAKAFTIAVKRETRPASFALKSITFLLGQGSNTANILKGFNVIK